VRLTIRPLKPDLWPHLEDLFGKKGACNGCWCMYCRIGAAYRKQPASKNKAAFRQVGYASTFARAGFKVVARRDPPRPIMRHDLKRVRDAGK
jgi:hypothetical protein